jgi:hypothetical protein
MGYARFSLDENSRPLCRGGSSAETGVSAFDMQKRRIAHRASLAEFLFF